MTIGSISSANNAFALNPRLQIQEALDRRGSSVWLHHKRHGVHELEPVQLREHLEPAESIQQNNPRVQGGHGEHRLDASADASSATIPGQALQNLADKFQQASQTGSMSSLERRSPLRATANITQASNPTFTQSRAVTRTCLRTPSSRRSWTESA